MAILRHFLLFIGKYTIKQVKTIKKGRLQRKQAKGINFYAKLKGEKIKYKKPRG